MPYPRGLQTHGSQVPSAEEASLTSDCDSLSPDQPCVVPGLRHVQIVSKATTIKHTLYDFASSLDPLGSASWCTLYGSARKRTYSNQPIFLFPKQNGCRFDWRASKVGMPRCSARSVWAPGVQIHHVFNFVGPPRSVCPLLRSTIPLYHGSAGWLAAMLVVWAPKCPSWGRRALIPRSCNTSVYLWLCQPSWVPWMCDLLEVSELFTALPACSVHLGFCIGNEGLPVGCAPNVPAKHLWVLGRCWLETFLRSACLGWLC
jgi:hypothetical protein